MPASTAQPATLDAETFAKFALVASGAEDSEIDAWLSRLRTLSADLKKETGIDGDDRAKAEAVISFLYRNVLTQYSQYQTRVDLALSSGSYNCVSSAILYAYFAKSVGLEVSGVETPEHAFCTIASGGKVFDVETTNPYGVDPGARKALPNSGDAQKRYAVVPKNYYYDRKSIDDRRFIALIYSNRISTLERQGNFEGSVGLSVDARELQGPLAPQKDLAVHFLNYAISLAGSGRSEDALSFISTVSERWGDCDGYRNFAATAIGNMVNERLTSKDFAGANSLLSNYSSMLDSATLAEYTRVIALQDLQHSAKSLGFGEARAEILSRRNDVAPSDFEKILSYAYAREADRICGNSNWLAAASFLDSGLKDLPGNRDLAQQRSVYRQNYAIEVHNAAVAEYRNGNVPGARKLLESGRAAIPESTMLENDLRQMR